MRIVILLVVLALASCGKKKPAQSPSGGAESKAMTEGAEEQDKAAPPDSDDPNKPKSDPQEGGE